MYRLRNTYFFHHKSLELQIGEATKLCWRFNSQHLHLFASTSRLAFFVTFELIRQTNDVTKYGFPQQNLLYSQWHPFLQKTWSKIFLNRPLGYFIRICCKWFFMSYSHSRCFFRLNHCNLLVYLHYPLISTQGYTCRRYLSNILIV